MRLQLKNSNYDDPILYTMDGTNINKMNMFRDHLLSNKIQIKQIGRQDCPEPEVMAWDVEFQCH